MTSPSDFAAEMATETSRARFDPEAWKRLEATYQRCCSVVTNSLGGLTPEAKVAAIATVFIEANRRGLA